MRRLNLVESFINFVGSKPPAFIFLICILSFIIILGSFVDYIKRNPIRNPDDMDWNVFRGRMASLDFCIKYSAPSETIESQALKPQLKKYITK